MKFVFIDPQGVWEGLNNGLASMAALLKREGHEVKVIDFVNRQGDEAARLQACKGADIIGISLKSFTLEDGIRLATIARSVEPRAVMAAGGPHVMIDGANLLRDNPIFDIGIKGEGEEVVLELASKKPFSEMSGLFYRNGNEIRETEKRDWITDLDSMPFPDYDDFDSIKSGDKIEKWPLVTSRGCPYTCSYCSVPVVIGRKFRTRSAKSIIAELKYAADHYGAKEFKVLDDNFTLLMDRAKDMCRKFIEAGIHHEFKWSCPNGIRADRLDPELLSLMKDAGCFSVSIGVESGDPEVFDKIRKGEKLADVEKGILMAKSAGLEVHGFFILGLVGSTYESDKRSMEFAKRVGLDSASWGILIPYPGTTVWDEVRTLADNGQAAMRQDWKKGFHIGARPKPVFDTPEYPAEERVRAFYSANMKFLKKRDIPKAAKIVIKSLIKGK